METIDAVTELTPVANPAPQPLAVQQQDTSQGAVMLRMIEAAVMRPDFDVEKMKALMEMKRQFDADEARRAYTAAMADFKRNAPTIVKDKHVRFETQKGVTEYDHATLGNVVKTIVAGLSEHGLSSAWKTERKDARIHVTCTITHRLGHSESVTLDGGPDDSGGKNSIQAIGSTVSYLQRYTLLAITGLATEGQDDDGAGSTPTVGAVAETLVDHYLEKLKATTTDEAAAAVWADGSKAIGATKNMDAYNEFKTCVVAHRTRLKGAQQ